MNNSLSFQSLFGSACDSFLSLADPKIEAIVSPTKTSAEQLLIDRENSLKAPATTRVPVPKHLQVFQTPTNINKYLTELYPNLRVYAQAKTGGSHNPDEIINNFMCYILGPCETGELRYTRYDPVKWSKMPYHKWIIQQFKFYCMSAVSNSFKASQIEVPISTTGAGYSKDGSSDDDILSLDLFSNYETDYTARIAIERLERYLAEIQLANRSVFCLEAFAHWIFRAIVEGYSNQEIAEYLDISLSATSQWRTRLIKIMADFMEVSNDGEPDDWRTVKERETYKLV